MSKKKYQVLTKTILCNTNGIPHRSTVSITLLRCNAMFEVIGP